MDPVEDVKSDLQAAATESDYAAVNTLWLALLKLANLERGKTELARMVALVNRIPDRTIRAIVGHPAVDSLLNLDPPLETVSSHSKETLETKEVADALEKIRRLRSSAPRQAMAGLGLVLKAIRNKREHGFKSRLGTRDSDILRPARQLLDELCRAGIQAQRSA